MSTKNNEPYSTLKFMAKPSDRKDDDEASKSNDNQLVAPEEDGDYGCQTPTSDDHKIPPPRISLPPPQPRKLLRKRRRRLSDDRTPTEFFENTRREEVDAFFRSFTVRVSSSTSRKTRSHSV
ncbi:hypothetical protein L2E82_33101 [Cichorium intybus]|uniref:Uncharacterized protein n=1 Tax=Cichorium intybus TaxID=13427 RepID=A0ACB9BJ95_CICIN|nr:hypothetical protein L2E82_33101 [Cichorium intybus]